MTSGLRDRAANRGSGGTPPANTTPIDNRGGMDVAAAPIEYDYLPLPELPADLREVPVHLLWANLMRDVRSIQRTSELPVQGKSVKFRGINEVIAGMSNAVRKYGMFIAPTHVDVTMTDTATGSGKPMRECVAVVTYAVMGPAGDRFEFVGLGQAADTGDRAATKAERVAYRNGLLDLLLASTGAPDPEETEFERGVPRVTPEEYRSEILTARPDRLLQIHKEIGEAGALDYVTTDGYGEPTTFRALIKYVGGARKEGRDPYPPREQPSAADEPTDTEGGN